ncbi:MAG: hypothetical protein AABM30_12755 [Actinomycetota bacterium]
MLIDLFEEVKELGKRDFAITLRGHHGRDLALVDPFLHRGTTNPEQTSSGRGPNGPANLILEKLSGRSDLFAQLRI